MQIPIAYNKLFILYNAQYYTMTQCLSDFSKLYRSIILHCNSSTGKLFQYGHGSILFR